MGEREQCLSGEAALTLQLRNHPVIPQKDYKGPEQLLLWFSLVLTQFNYVFLILKLCNPDNGTQASKTPSCTEVRHGLAQEG